MGEEDVRGRMIRIRRGGARRRGYARIMEAASSSAVRYEKPDASTHLELFHLLLVLRLQVLVAQLDASSFLDQPVPPLMPPSPPLREEHLPRFGRLERHGRQVERVEARLLLGHELTERELLDDVGGFADHGASVLHVPVGPLGAVVEGGPRIEVEHVGVAVPVVGHVHGHEEVTPRRVLPPAAVPHREHGAQSRVPHTHTQLPPRPLPPRLPQLLLQGLTKRLDGVEDLLGVVGVGKAEARVRDVGGEVGVRLRRRIVRVVEEGETLGAGASGVGVVEDGEAEVTGAEEDSPGLHGRDEHVDAMIELVAANSPHARHLQARKPSAARTPDRT
eukprot:600361-Hanusia_phi.AAC.2